MPEAAAARLPRVDEGERAGRNTTYVTLAATLTLGMLASTIYVPSIRSIAHALNTSIARVQFTFVGYLLSFAFGMLALGPLSDRFGRRRTMICGLVLSVLSSAACAMSPTIEFLIGARIIQGVGACAGLVVGRATIRGLYGREGAAQVIAGLGIVMTLMQSFAPIPGGYIDTWIGWRANFVAVTAFAVAALTLAIRYIPETRKAEPAWPEAAMMSAGAMLQGYRTLLRTRRFMAYALTAAGSHAGFHIFAAGAPAVLIGSFGISAGDYGYFASLPPIGFLFGSFISNRVTRRVGADLLIGAGGTLLIPAGSVMVALACLHIASPYIIVAPMILVCCASGLITPNAVACSLGVNPSIVGAASGLASCLQMAGAAAATAALSLGASGNPLTLAIVIAATGMAGIIAFASMVQRGPAPVEMDARAGA
jgi:MFS transporter, DHA1 family, multidrug resistance protein